MNKFYKVIWNATLGRYVVASELSQGRKKSKSSCAGAILADVIFSRKMLLTCILSALATEKTFATDSEVGFFTPQDSAYSIISGQVNLITGGSNGFANISKGDPGYKNFTLQQALDAGIVTSGSEYISGDIFKIGKKSQTISYTDKQTQNQVTVSVYDNANMAVSSAASFMFPNSYAVGEHGQYVDTNLFSVKSGGDLTVNVGSTAANWVNNAANNLSVIMKGSQKDIPTASVFDVSGTGALDYNSKTVATLGNTNNNNSGAKSVASFVGGFNNAVTSKIGNFVVNDLAGFQAYNIALQNAIKTGALAATDYDAEIAKAYDTTLKQVYVSANIPANDATNMNVDRDRVSFIKADGADTRVNISKDANIQLYNSDASLVRLLNGAVLNNLGVLGTAYNSLRGAYVVYANNSVVNNQGVIDAGTNPEMQAYTPAKSKGSNTGIGMQVGINANGNSRVLNDGIINVAPVQDYALSTGVSLNDTATFVNNGAINVAALPPPASVNGGYVATGVIVQNQAKFDNNGQLYIGRQAQRSLTDMTSDVLVNQFGTVGVNVIKGGVFNNNATANITLGSQTQGATAISASDAASVVNQKGTIDINGRVAQNGDSSGLNTGISSSGGAKQVTNSGTINLNGINAKGLMVNAGSTATNSGTINVNQGVDPVSKTANYGIQAEGAGAVATQSGTVALKGDRAIGIYAKNKGVVKLEGAGQVAFDSGENQLGYFVYGAGSAIVDNSAGEQNVSTKGSTLYRIDGGSTFAGSDSSTSVMKASGENSTILLVTGKSDDGKTISKLNTGKMVLNVNAKGATAVKVEGGAQGVLDQGVILALTAENATAGIVDGNSTSIMGAAGATGASQLTSYAKIDNTNAATGAMGYIARNNGTLIHKGSLSFTAADSTGVLVDGGKLENSSDISVNGIAVDIVGGSSKVLNTGTVTATGGTAAYRLKDGASLALSGQGTTIAKNGAHGVLLDVPTNPTLLRASPDPELTVTDATISVTETGNAIENAAEVAGIRIVNAKLNVEQGAAIRTGAELGLSNSGVITVNGSGKGIALMHADGSATTADLNLLDSDGLTINVTGENGSGIVTNTSGSVKNGTTVNVQADNGGAALAVGGTTTNVLQAGQLNSTSLTTEVVNLDNGKVNSFTNSGAIKAKDASQIAVLSNSGNGMAFNNNSGAEIIGKVNLLKGDNTVNLQSGSKGTDFFTGNGVDIFNLVNIGEQETSLFTSLNGGEGKDTLNLDNSQYILKDANAITGMETVNLKNGSRLTEANVLLALGDDKADRTDTTFNIDESSSLVLNNTSDVEFKNHLAGSGTVKADLTNKAFTFTNNNKADGFNGTLDLANSTFALADVNTQALSAARLKLSSGSIATVGQGQQNIGGLTFNGGTADFGALNPGMTIADNLIHTANNLDISGQGVIKVALTNVINDNPLPDNHLPLMAQDDAQTLVKMADSSGTVTGSGGNLKLVDQDGNEITDAATVDITQAGETVAKGTWDYRMTSGENADGLYINYGLKQVELLGVGVNSLVLDSNGASGVASDLSAKVTGNGDLHIDTGTGNVSLSNLDNDYLGETLISSGTLDFANDNVLGKTRRLTIEELAFVDTHGFSQSIGALNTAAGSLLDLSEGSELTITDAQRSAGDVNGGFINADTLAGAGKLVIDPSVVTVNGANTGFTGDVVLQGGSQVLLNNVSGLGDSGRVTLTGENDRLTFAKQLATDAATVGNLAKQLAGVGSVELKDNADINLVADNRAFAGDFSLDSGTHLRATDAKNLGDASISNNGSLHLTADNDWELANAVTGSGELEKLGSAALIVNRDLAYTGETNLRAGSLILGDDTAANGKLSGNGQVNITEGATLGGNGEVTGSVTNQGTIAALNAMSGYEDRAVGDFKVGSLNNSGTVNLAGSSVGNTLTVNGNYAGNNGLLKLNTALGDDNSVTDKLVVKGDTSGNTRVQVNNLGGQGAQTIKGIEVVHVDGASEGNFALQGRAVAGAYDYFLNKGNAGDGNWYLQSQTPAPAPDPANIVGPVDPVDPANPTDPIVRPEAGAYTANIAAANTMFVTTLHDRLGETNYVDMLTGETKVTSMWMRNIGGHTAFRDNSGQLKTQSNRYVLQMGGDIAQWGSEAENRTHLGVMAGYGNNQSNTRSSVTHYSADGAVNGYSVGVYGTWFANEAEHTGAYVDTWAQYNWFNNSVKGDELDSESYKSKGITASAETGYTFKAGEYSGSKGSTNAWYVQPQAQAIWMGVKADDHTESNGTHVSSQGDGNLMTRLGVRTYLKGHNKMDDGKDREFQPFVEANWIHNTNNFGATMNGVSSSMDGAKNIAELKVGVEGQLNKNLNVWGNVASQVGDKGYNDNAAMIGVKYNF
ncbi:autotransporter outer membrane beta-barrel domain-containing protein [Buttiauxella sp. WJP83]|uniref:autotransporter outer membrane beta-barrel domain-containing protein n=1 Tax=Buttiauxella sp. WJP83 TaxID=2986951 RepID=UPI0022DDC9EC|nr:autotransporter outer membrane beta-barrel domain-containing protein [Buttiauxella sp. WJP83]WBM72293.1 autotransporter outer membrane beta-barrel domain-containing protein [Buttiauxella sp. WJP83]